MFVGAMKCFKIFGYESVNPALRVYIDPDAWLMACEELQRYSIGYFVESDLSYIFFWAVNGVSGLLWYVSI